MKASQTDWHFPHKVRYVFSFGLNLRLLSCPCLQQVSAIEGSGSDLTGVSDTSSSIVQMQVAIFESHTVVSQLTLACHRRIYIFQKKKWYKDNSTKILVLVILCHARPPPHQLTKVTSNHLLLCNYPHCQVPLVQTMWMSISTFVDRPRHPMSRQILSTLLPQQKTMVNSNLLQLIEAPRLHSHPHPHPSSSK